MSCRDGSPRKRTAIKAWNCGEVCGGEDRGVPCCSEGGQSTQKLDGVDPLTLKKGSVRGEGQKKKSERANNTGQVRGACQTGRQIESCRCAGTHTQKKRRPDCPRRSICWGVRDCLHWEREMREIFKSYTCQTHEGGAGKADLFESGWRSTGTAQQLPRLPHKVQRQRAKKSALEGVGAGDSKKKGPSILFLGQSTHRQKADILSFPSRGRPPLTFYPITVFSSLGAKKKIRVLPRYCGTA